MSSKQKLIERLTQSQRMISRMCATGTPLHQLFIKTCEHLNLEWIDGISEAKP